jgi:hypothetical protein
VIGGIFAVSAIIQAWRIWSKKDAIHKLEHPEEVTHHIEEQIEKFEEGLDKITHKDKDKE